MPFQNIYAEATEAGIFDNIYGEQSQQSLANTVIEQSKVLEYGGPSLCSAQLSTSPYYQKAPVSSNPAKGDGFSFQYPPPTPVDELPTRFGDISITYESPGAQSRLKSTRSPDSHLKSLAKNSARNQLSPPPRNLPTKKVGTRGKKPNKGTFCRAYGYQPLFVTPTSWDIFEYNSFGELKPGQTYSAHELVRYLYTNPQHHVFGETYNPKLGGLTLWVQRTPEDFANDYGNPEAGLCRFQNCDHNNVIKAGDIRVAFDELTKRILNLNPLRNAGYVHLSCLEKKTSFPMLCKDLDIKPEARVLPLEITHGNPMTFQERTVIDHVQRFIDFCNKMERAPNSYPAQGRLIDEILKLEQPRKLKEIATKPGQKKSVQWDDEDKAKNQYSKDMYNVSNTGPKRDDVRAKKRVVRQKRARAENEIMSESEEEHARGGAKARSIMRPRGRTSRAPSSLAPEFDYDSSALTKPDTESEEDEARSRKYARYAPTPRLPGRDRY